MRICDLNATTLRDTLIALLLKAGVDYLQYCRLAKQLKSIGVGLHQRDYDFQLRGALVAVEQHWLAQLLAKLTVHYAHGSRAELSMDDMPSGLNREFPWGKCAPEDLEAGVRYWMGLYDFDQLIAYLTERCGELEQQGKVLAARDLGIHLALDEAKRTPRHLVAKVRLALSGCGYYHESSTRAVKSLSCAFKIAASEMGLPSLAAAMNSYYEAVHSMAKHDVGLKQGHASTVLITNRKQHIEFKFAADQADALLAFVKMYAPDMLECVA
ncbi:hypothetical protein IC617_08550 [Neiella sp. HB171785]|uniref:Uncharacterized protein n=1 Tax=Neiella litorisoli TaxID=2771431 RepID=A0A8J6ULS9_9GAMM|nr:hypothetical protein [Neiella litorisoli]MBD1389475.1 hypothetical protein [Neiella litorisoli]